MTQGLHLNKQHEGGSVRSDSTPLRVNNKVPLKMSRMYWNSRDQMHFLGLEYCKKNFSKKSFRNLKKGHWILVIVQLLGLIVTDSAKLSWAAKKSKQKQTAYCGAIHPCTETTEQKSSWPLLPSIILFGFRAVRKHRMTTVHVCYKSFSLHSLKTMIMIKGLFSLKLLLLNPLHNFRYLVCL